MNSPSTPNSNSHRSAYDVVICGAGLAGLTLARQIQRHLPHWKVALVDRARRPLPEATWKVGESSVEVGSQYFESLGLTDYLLDRQLVKFGLRFFPGGGHLPLHHRNEIGPSQEPPVRSYQLDRGRFENDLRAMNEQDGIILYEGTRVDAIELGEPGSEHQIHISELSSDPGRTNVKKKTLNAKWVVDASGREALLRNALELTEKSGHTAHSGWFRVEGRVDINDWVPNDDASGQAFHSHQWSTERWRSTNHLMGPGYWCWIIPLASGNTSIGVVVHNELHSFSRVRSLGACLEFMQEHEPQLHGAVKQHRTLDFRCLSGYSHTASAMWSDKRFAMVGEAGAFVDPLYSPGSDFIGFANCFTLELLQADEAGRDLGPLVDATNDRYRALVSHAINLFRQAAPVYGHADAMAAKVYFDNFAYWSFMAQYFVQGIYRLHGPEHDEYVNLGLELSALSDRVQGLLRRWACFAPCSPRAEFVGMPRYPSLLVDAYMDLRKRQTPSEAKALLAHRLEQARDIAAELALRLFISQGCETAALILEAPQLATNPTQFDWVRSAWPFAPARLMAELLPSLERRKRLSLAARDVERTLGKVLKHVHWEHNVREALSAFGSPAQDAQYCPGP